MLAKTCFQKLTNSDSEFVGNKVKGRISKRVFQGNKARQIFRKLNVSLPAETQTYVAYQRVIIVRFSENLTGFVFLKHPFWDSTFCLITEELSNQTFNDWVCFCELLSSLKITSTFTRSKSTMESSEQCVKSVQS